MRSPRTYNEWVNSISRFQSGENDQETLDAMCSGYLEWQVGVADRFTKRLTEAAVDRIQKAVDQFQVNFSRTAGTESAIVQSILNLRKELKVIESFMNLPILPEDTRGELIHLVQSQRDQIQKSLEDSAKSDRTGKLMSLVRNNRVNR
ncbi:hypothetical protein [Enterococcus sp. DIV0187]|uniref:hypothetical protein n=1 Tax=Enterococcus sp. DIV0187 TaxID=2774644 RepID=UPI003F20F18A